ncbi:hypothetical protein EST38_g7407 [Candolleomyces aberdarensis]|uniref:Uncharacterized protein n=1 Tax=Candolleomyces aberdarensis TaxID=2316362 RepID=A0A4Q2DF69_9AGAR|nr:hypothetical protein EST38_g7407 [Candolleomyces aberdarensis]
MASDHRHRASKDSRSTSRTAQSKPGVEAGTPSTGLSKLELVQQALFSPFNHKKSDSTRILSDLAPAIMTPRMMNSAATVSSRPRNSIANTRESRSAMDFATIGRAPFRLGLGSRRITAGDLQIVEATEELLQAEVPEPEGVAADVSLLRGFNATIPSSDQSRTRRRQMRNVDTPKLGLKKLGMSARGLLTEEEEHDGQSVASEDDLVVIPSQKKKRGRESLSAAKRLGKEELTRQVSEIMRDKENLHVRRSLVKSEIAEITDKIRALDVARSKLEKDLLKLQEDELELEDELEGVKERMRSRRRKGPAFLPSEHDELPPGVAFMTLDSHTTPITALDISEPYGTLVSASEEDAQPRVWDLLTGTEIGRLRGHIGAVKCLQIEDNVCLTGGEDGNVRLWDLRKVDEDDGWGSRETDRMPDVIEEEDENADDGELLEKPSGIRSRTNSTVSKDGPCARVLEGHSRAVTALYFEDDCLVTGASDKTLRQWDLTTGQCVMTMDILWAMSHSSNSSSSTSGFDPYSSFSMPNPAASHAWDAYDDFVGGVQFWGYGLVSGSGDGAVRMWDMRTGQAHRTLSGHTGPITCLQFDELHIATGSLDKTLRLWDLRTGSVVETMQFENPVTSLQFDTRKIVAATGENGVKVQLTLGAILLTVIVLIHRP